MLAVHRRDETPIEPAERIRLGNIESAAQMEKGLSALFPNLTGVDDAISEFRIRMSRRDGNP
ncbi:MAG: hypothetical protein QM766_20630 [Burkholderiaceae bacterium]